MPNPRARWRLDHLRNERVRPSPDGPAAGAEGVSVHVRALIVLTCLLAACSTNQWTYQKAEAPESERQTDDVECRANAKVPRVSRPIVLEGTRLVSYPYMGIDVNVYNLCMRAKGYIIVGN